MTKMSGQNQAAFKTSYKVWDTSKPSMQEGKQESKQTSQPTTLENKQKLDPPKFHHFTDLLYNGRNRLATSLMSNSQNYFEIKPWYLYS